MNTHEYKCFHSNLLHNFAYKYHKALQTLQTFASSPTSPLDLVTHPKNAHSHLLNYTLLARFALVALHFPVITTADCVHLSVHRRQKIVTLKSLQHRVITLSRDNNQQRTHRWGANTRNYHHHQFPREPSAIHPAWQLMTKVPAVSLSAIVRRRPSNTTWTMPASGFDRTSRSCPRARGRSSHR